MKRLTRLLILNSIIVLNPLYGDAQITIFDMEALSNQTARLWFHAENTSTTNYSVEFSPDLTGSNMWTSIPGTVISDIGSNDYEVIPLPLTNTAGFFRILSADDLRAWFDSAEISVDEGTGTIDIQIQFSGHFTGTLAYSVEGTGIDSIANPSGVLEVDDTSATLTLTMLDNATIDPLRYLSIALQAATGLTIGSPGTATVNILENDAVWQGSLQTETGTLGFQLQMIDDSALLQGEFGSGGFGFFPSYPIPAQIALSDTAFSANVTNIPIAAEATLLDTPMNLALDLFADETLMGGGVQNVSINLIEGTGTLIIDIPAMPHLNTTNHGTFVLQKPPVSPSTNEVELVDSP